MVDAVGRPPKPESEKYESRQLAFRAPRNLEAAIFEAMTPGESITDFMRAAAEAEVRRRRRRHTPKEPR